jgi:D-alanyl-lipoteichoic acid acyltransferase DltB (MBOAT superfamily)
MSLVSTEALFLLPLLLIVYWLSPRKASIQNLILVVASYLFYITWHWQMLSVVIAGTLIDFLTTRNMPGASMKRKRILLGISIAYGLGTLGFFKYENFFAASANSLFTSLGVEMSVPMLEILLPLGISFYTLQRLGYVFDVYLERSAPAGSLLRFAAFACYFPQLTAGPIARAEELLIQLKDPRHLDFDRVFDGLAAFLLGYALASWAAPVFDEALVAPTFNAVGELNALSHWLGAVGFALQVFADFAGYSLIAIGISRLFGIELPQNFDAPFISRSVPEFWRRWHITLNRWLFDYIFTPMTTSRGYFRGKISLALLITFLASGLWHGAAWTFLLWGLIHAVAMIVQHVWNLYYSSLCRKDRKFVTWRRSAWYNLGSWALTMAVFAVSMVPFRSPGIGATGDFFAAMISTEPAEQIRLSGSLTLALIFIAVVHIARLPLMAPVFNLYGRVPAYVRGGLYGALTALVLTMVPAGDGVFIYQGF